MVEDVVDLPAELKVALLVDLYVLKERKVVVEDAGHANRISWQVADLSRCPGLRYA